MPSLIVLALLTLPVVFSILYRRPWARVGLALVWLACGGVAVFFFRGVADLQRDLDTVHRYDLPSSTGDHSVPIRRLSQGSMLGVLTVGEGRPSRAELERLKWTFPPGVAVEWFDVRHEDVAADEAPLFQVAWSSSQDPVTLTYHVDDSSEAVLKSRVLVVRHDSSARHMLRDHGVEWVRLLAWAAAGWAGLWLLVQMVAERLRRRPLENVETAGTG
jgi:hypothetical protein